MIFIEVGVPSYIIQKELDLSLTFQSLLRLVSPLVFTSDKSSTAHPLLLSIYRFIAANASCLRLTKPSRKKSLIA